MFSITCYKLSAGHCIVILIRDAYPINVLTRLKDVPELVNTYCATANPIEVIFVETGLQGLLLATVGHVGNMPGVGGGEVGVGVVGIQMGGQFFSRRSKALTASVCDCSSSFANACYWCCCWCCC
jgi:hypothetical protein